jgi:hypothetical protein
MSATEDNALRLRAYLLTLTSSSRCRLRESIESGTAGGGTCEAEATLAELRRLADDARTAAASVFFRPLAAFLVDDQPARRHPGRIARASLPALWAWLRHDLLPGETAAFARTATEALEAGDAAQAEGLASAFQDRVAAALRAVFADDDELARRRLILRIGTPRAADEAASLRWILRGRDALAALYARLPAIVPDLPGDQIAACRALIEAAARPREVFIYALLAVMRRLAAPWQIVRLAIHAADSSGAARIAQTAYGVVVDILVADIERQIDALGAALAEGDGIGSVALIRKIDTVIQGLQAEMEIPVGSTLGRRLSGLSAEAAAVARAAIAA